MTVPRGDARRTGLALVSTVHDPAARLLPAFSERSHFLDRYDAVYLAATNTTATAVVGTLRTVGASLLVEPPGTAGASQRRALAAAVEASHASFFCCDFDRWLHWAGRFPEELASLPQRIAQIQPAPWYVCLGRTARAFATHPPVQRAAERATNRALALALRCHVDATAGACWLSKEGAAIIVAESTEPSKATDLEWPALVYRAAADRVAPLFTEGLEFETATFHLDEIAATGGIQAWVRQTYDRPEVWRDRLRLAADSVGALVRLLGTESILSEDSGTTRGSIR